MLAKAFIGVAAIVALYALAGLTTPVATISKIMLAISLGLIVCAVFAEFLRARVPHHPPPWEDWG